MTKLNIEEQMALLAVAIDSTEENNPLAGAVFEVLVLAIVEDLKEQGLDTSSPGVYQTVYATSLILASLSMNPTATFSVVSPAFAAAADRMRRQL